MKKMGYVIYARHVLNPNLALVMTVDHPFPVKLENSMDNIWIFPTFQEAVEYVQIELLPAFGSHGCEMLEIRLQTDVEG